MAEAVFTKPFGAVHPGKSRTAPGTGLGKGQSGRLRERVDDLRRSRRRARLRAQAPDKGEADRGRGEIGGRSDQGRARLAGRSRVSKGRAVRSRASEVSKCERGVKVEQERPRAMKGQRGEQGAINDERDSDHQCRCGIICFTQS